VGIPTYNRSDLLRNAITSALSQSFHNLAVLVADNASSDDTAAVVSSFNDERLHYVRRVDNIGSQDNFNKIVDEVSTEFVLILPDDDWLYPRHIEETLKALDAFPTAGFADTAYDVVDAVGMPIYHDQFRYQTKSAVDLESRTRLRERAMSEDWLACWPTVLMRTEAVRAAGRFRPEDGDVMDDFGLLLRMSRSWDAVHIRSCLAAFRMHAATTTAEFGTFSESGYVQPISHYELLRDIRLRSIVELDVSMTESRRLRRLAQTSHRRVVIGKHADAAFFAQHRFPGIRSAGELARADRRFLLMARTWRLVAADLGGRRLKRLVRDRRTSEIE
jgi:hypothetical protein